MSVSPDDGGSVKVDGVDYTAPITYTSNTNVTLKAEPAEGYEFSHWTGSYSSSSNPATLSVTCDKSVTANFLSQTDLASIGNFVWEDKDADGIQDTGENGISGVTVNLYDSGGNFIKATTTSGDGFYSFTYLQPGSYYLEFIKHSGGYVFSPVNQGNSEQVDSDADFTGRTSITTLNSGEIDMSWDAGMYRPTILNYTIQLSPGLNLVSLPLIPDDLNDPYNALLGLNAGAVSMYAKDSEAWIQYINGDLVPPSGFLWKDGIGYWITMGSPADNLTIDGVELVSGATLPPSYEVFGKDSPTYNNGWNLIGFKSTTPKQPMDYLENIEGKYRIIYGYENGSFFIVGTPGHELMQPGQGYWIDMIEPGTIYPPLEQIIGNITTEEAHDMIYAEPSNPNLVVLDVRTPAEYATGHIVNAANLDYYSPTFTEDLNNLDKTATYIVHCRSGVRSAWALDIMEGLGFREAYNMLGGILQWIDDGYDVVS